jgi:exopolysaccharide biosynthesis polyprenyl glycosylphosphotransferase
VPVAVFFGFEHNVDALLGVGVLAAVWFLALEAIYGGVRLSPFVLGLPMASALGTVTGLAIVSVLNFWLPLGHLEPTDLLALAGAIFVSSLTVEAVATKKFARRHRRVLVVGAAHGGAQLVDDLARNPKLAFDCVGLVGVNGDEALSPGHRFAGRVSDLRQIVSARRPDVIVFAGADPDEEALEAVFDAKAHDFRIVGVDEFYEYAFGYVPLLHLSPTWFLGILHLYRRPYRRITKRAFDLGMVTIALVLAAPFFPLIALLVRASSRGPILFRQVRLGEGGKPFAILKFRTMVDGAEEPGKPIWAAEHDLRVTPVGRLLRQTHLDELPQLWNVLRGDMSVVGPRPERPEFFDLLQAQVPFWTRRNLVKPGITGWAQLSHGYTSDVDGAVGKLAYDLYYLKHHSLLLDLAIAARTAGALLPGASGRWQLS